MPPARVTARDRSVIDASDSAVFAAAWQRASEVHPTITLDPALFCAFAAERIAGDPRVELARRHVADLYLACACSAGDGAALAVLEQQVLPTVERALASFADRADVLQMLRERMLVETDGVRGIAAYDGRAPLTMWLRVCATRLGIRQVERARRVAPVDDHQLEQLAPGIPDPQLAYLKRFYGEQFRSAFARAVASLTSRERNLLRFSVIDGLGIDQIAAIYHVHRATAARQLKQARATLVELTRATMRSELKIRESELESIMRMIVGMTDITLRHVLAKERGQPRETT